MKKKNTEMQKHQYKIGEHLADAQVQALVKKYADSGANSDVIQEMITTAIKASLDGLDRSDLKIMNTALKEMRYSFKTFKPFRRVRKVAIFGSARTKSDNKDYVLAKQFAALIVQRGWMVITGAASGVMQAGNEGAGTSNSFGLNIRLPFEQDANPVMLDDKKLINFKYFFTRKLMFMRESDATVLCPGGFGTHDEGFETLTLIQTGKADPRPIVCLDHPKSKYWAGFTTFCKQQLARQKLIDPRDMDLIYFTHSAQDAADYVSDFYRTYHSMRFVNGQLVIRLLRKLERSELAILNREFKDIILKGSIRQVLEPFEEEQETGHFHSHPRIYFHFVRNHFFRLQHLIQRINAWK